MHITILRNIGALMKKPFLILGTFLLSASSVHGFSWLPKPPEPKSAEIIPEILYPHGWSLTHGTYLFGVSYLGGAVGQIEKRVATSGVVSPRVSKRPTSGSIISASNQWVNGFQLDFCGTTSGLGEDSFGLNYSFFSGGGISTTTLSQTPGNEDILPSFALNNVTGATALVDSVTSKYSVPSFQDGFFSYSKSLFVNPWISLMVTGGIHGFSVVHKLLIDYKQLSGAVTTLKMKENTFGAGPLIGFIGTKKVTDDFALRGTFLASAPLSNHTLQQSDEYRVGSETTYGYSANSTNQLRQHFVAHMDLEAVFRRGFLNQNALELIIAWHVKQYLNQSFLTAMSNNQNTPPSTLQVNALRVGLSTIF
jgi:hypothetical protein